MLDGVSNSIAAIGEGAASSTATVIDGGQEHRVAQDYREKLRACHVIVDHAEREALIRDKAKAAASEAPEEAAAVADEAPAAADESAPTP